MSASPSSLVTVIGSSTSVPPLRDPPSPIDECTTLAPEIENVSIDNTVGVLMTPGRSGMVLLVSRYSVPDFREPTVPRLTGTLVEPLAAGVTGNMPLQPFGVGVLTGSS